MKKICITFILLFIIILTAAVSLENKGNEGEYLRLHVRANSDAAVDQSVKYKVKDAIVEYLTPFVAECTTKAEAYKTVSSLLDKIGGVGDRVLAENGFSYRAKAYLRVEEFPTRTYGEYTLEAGEYDALIVELGEAAGANWWCVVYPPLCFTASGSGENLIYRSKIYDIIKEFFNR